VIEPYLSAYSFRGAHALGPGVSPTQITSTSESFLRAANLLAPVQIPLGNRAAPARRRHDPLGPERSPVRAATTLRAAFLGAVLVQWPRRILVHAVHH